MHTIDFREGKRSSGRLVRGGRGEGVRPSSPHAIGHRFNSFFFLIHALAFICIFIGYMSTFGWGWGWDGLGGILCVFGGAGVMCPVYGGWGETKVECKGNQQQREQRKLSHTHAQDE